MLSSFPCHNNEAIHCARPTAGVASSGASWMQRTTLTRAHFCPFFCSMKKRCMSATFICLLYDQTISAFFLLFWRCSQRPMITFVILDSISDDMQSACISTFASGTIKEFSYVALCCRTNKDLYPPRRLFTVVDTAPNQHHRGPSTWLGSALATCHCDWGRRYCLVERCSDLNTH